MSKYHRNPKKLNHYAKELRGPAQNRYGGHQTQNLRGWGVTGKANEARSYTKEEMVQWEQKNKRLLKGNNNDNYPGKHIELVIWKEVNIGKHAGKILPEILLSDLQYFFWALYQQELFSREIKVQADILARRASNIKIPERYPSKSEVEYLYDEKKGLLGFQIVDSASEWNESAVLRSPKIDLSLIRRFGKNKERGSQRLIGCMKAAYFGHHSFRLDRIQSGKFFNDPANFDLRSQ